MIPLLLLFAALAASQDPAWEPLGFLVGEWVGEGTGSPGESAGGTAFRFSLDGKVLVRDNWAEYPATKDRPAFSHRDLMVIYREPGQAPFRAIYFDNEGHTIHYTITAENDRVQFLSDTAPSSPRYRLTYLRTGADTHALTFEIAPPAKPDAFTVYIKAKARRKL